MKWMLPICLALCGCQHQMKMRLEAPPECVRVTSPVELTPDGKQILPHSHFSMQISCTRYAKR